MNISVIELFHIALTLYQAQNMKQKADQTHTTIGSVHIIRLAASFKHVTGSYVDKRMPKSDAPAICGHK